MEKYLGSQTPICKDFKRCMYMVSYERHSNFRESESEKFSLHLAFPFCLLE